MNQQQQQQHEDGLQWFHGSIGRDRAAQLLSQPEFRHNGCFLLRNATGQPNKMVLSMRCQDLVNHYVIQWLGDNKYQIDMSSRQHQGLDTLIQHYKQEEDGLPCRLTQFCRGGFPPFKMVKLGARNQPIHTAVRQPNSRQLQELLLNPKALHDIDARDEHGFTALHLACIECRLDMATELLRKGADKDAHDANEITPLKHACIKDHTVVAEYLINNARADINERHVMSGWVPLHYAARSGSVGCVKVLFEAQAAQNPRTNSGDIPKDVALASGNFDLVTFIDSYPFSPPATEIAACLHGNISRDEGVQTLLASGKDDGRFLIRNSKSDQCYYVLSMLFNGEGKHFQILCRNDRWYYIDDGPLFSSVPHLLDHYKLHTDGLNCVLRTPVSPKSYRPSLNTAAPQQKSAAQNPTPNFSGKPMPKPPGPPKKTSINATSPHIAALASEVGRVNLFTSNKPLGPTNGSVRIPNAQTDNKPSVPRRKAPSVPNTPPHTPIRPGPGAASSRPELPGRPGAPEAHPPAARQGVPLPRVPQKKTNPHENIYAATKTPHDIPYNTLELGSELGEGEFGSVLKGKWRNEHNETIPVALKTLHNDKLQTGKDEFLREARVMSQLNHKHIVRLLGVCSGPPMILVQELVSMGALLDYLMEHEDEVQLNDHHLWASQIASGMAYLEQKKFVHRDLATRNILLASKVLAKISDFGLSRASGSGSDYYQAKQGGRWPVKWYAPESVNYGRFSGKTDVWSYGITLWEMFTYGELPYGEMSGPDVLSFIESGRRLRQPDGCPQFTYEIMLQCWHLDPNQRPSFQELHETFSQSPDYEDARKYRDSFGLGFGD